MSKTNGYCVDWKWCKHPAGLIDNRSHYKTLSDARYWIKQAIKDDSIYKDSVKVYHGWDHNKVDVTKWALEPLQKLIKE